MPPRSSVEVWLLDDLGYRRAVLDISLLPRTDPASTPAPLELGSTEEEESGASAIVRLLEGQEYHYQVRDVYRSGTVVLHPRELFEPDDARGTSGRLRPALSTGRIHIECHVEGGLLGRGALEVRSRKLDYLLHYRWMLRDIAEVAAELIMERFAPSEQRFQLAETAEARTLYQRFEFLRTLISGEEFDSAIHQILARPYVLWSEFEELRRPEEGIRLTSRVARELFRPGPRVRGAANSGPLQTLPASLRIFRTEPIVDNLPNRFVKFALVSWRDTVESIRIALEREARTLPVDRGLREVELLLGRIQALLAHELFREVGPLVHFPAANQVLQKRQGYREVFRAYIQFELASKLAWQGGEDIYWAGQRNVATLYEYWAFLQVAQILSELCDRPINLGSLIQVTSGGLTVDLARREAKELQGQLHRLGRVLHTHLWFNRPFSLSDGGSWTRPMRPDVSLLVDVPGEPNVQPVWVHFDAKYRVESITQIMGAEDAEIQLDSDEGSSGQFGRARSGDLLKMHAYKDAIRRSAGAYILYPGDQEEIRRTYHELLPGLGAFVLRPTDNGPAEGHFPLRQFIDDVLTHVASQVSQHERARFWQAIAHAEAPTQGSAIAAEFLSRPPADTEVLLGYVRGKKHLSWIHRNGLYNLRADGRTGSVGLRSRELAAEILILWGSGVAAPEIWSISGPPQLLTGQALSERGYPGPRGDLYFCLGLGRNLTREFNYQLPPARVEEVRRNYQGNRPNFAPIPVSWLDLVAD